MIVYPTGMNELPEDCTKCTVMDCRLPINERSRDWEYKKKYTTKRHENCPLLIIDAEYFNEQSQEIEV